MVGSMYVYILGNSDNRINTPRKNIFKNPLKAFLNDSLSSTILFCSESQILRIARPLWGFKEAQTPNSLGST